MTNAMNTGLYGRVNPGPGFGDEYSYTDDAVLTAAQDGASINNAGAAKAIEITLPPAIAGREFSIARIAGYSISVLPSGSDTITTGNPGVSYVINSDVLTVFYCRADGAWRIAVGGNKAYLIDARSLGADPTGVVDSTAAIQAAIDTGPAYLPPGTYKTTAPLTILNGQSLKGDGIVSIINASSVTGAVIALGNGGVIGDNRRLGIEKIRITGSATRAIDIDNVQSFWVRDISIGGSYGGFTGTDGVRTKKCWDGEISAISTSGSDISNCHFLFGEAFNSVQVSYLYTGGQAPLDTNVAFKIDHTDNSGTLTSSGSAFSNLIAQSTGIGFWARSCEGGLVDGLYVENVVRPIVFGEYSASKSAKAVTINSPVIYSITNTNPGYANRKAVIDFSQAIACSVNNPNLEGCASLYDVAPLTFSGGTGTEAIAVARMTTAGVIHSVEVLYGGNYSVAPTACDAANVTGETLTPVMSGTAVASVTVTDGGTGGDMTNKYPVAITYQYAVRCTVRSPAFYAGSSIAGHAWLSPVYPLLVRTASGIGYAGVNIENEFSFKQAGANYSGESATLRKVTGAAKHAIIEYDTNGAHVGTPYTPPVYP
jgi:hypothetical protein